MPIATPEVYADMLDRAKAGAFAYPAINITSSQTINAAIRGFAEAGSDGIIQVSTGGADFASGSNIKNMVTGASALAAFAYEVAKNYSVNIALHTDHCPKDKLDGYMRPLIDVSLERVAAGKLPLFQSHMWDGSAVPLEENLQCAQELLALTAAANIILEVEIGVVGGEEDGVANEINDQLYTTTEDALKTVEALGLGAVWTGVHPNQGAVDSLRSVIDLPDSLVPFCVIPIGHPAGSTSPKDKFDASRIHWNKW